MTQLNDQSLDVLIINSPLFREKVNEYDEDSLPPLGLGYIATDLLSNGMTEGTNFIIGGLSTKSLWKTIFSWDTSCSVDVVIGEGDFVVSAIVQGKPLDIIYQEGDKRVILVSTSSPYFPCDISNISLNRSFFVNQPLKHALGFNEVSIVTSRGCMYNCAFCSAARSLNTETPIRERSVLSVANEVSILQETYKGLNSIRVLDDLFLRNSKSVDRAVRIFENIPVTWRSMAHVLLFYNLNDSQLLELRRSGCIEIFVGIESGSPRILKKIHKTSNIELIKRTIKRLFDVGISVKGYFIFGFDTETLKDMEMSYELAL